MEFTLVELISAFGVSLIAGMTLAVVYEPFRLFHKLGFSDNIHYLICDFIFMIIAAFITYFLCLSILEGCVRVFVIIGEAIGFTCFSFVIRPILNRIYEPIIKISKKIAENLLKYARKVMYNVKSKSIIMFNCIKSKVLNNVRKKKERSFGADARVRNNKRSKTQKKKA